MIKLSQITVAIAVLAMAAAPALAGPIGGDSVCAIGFYNTSDEFVLDLDDNGIWGGVASDARFKIAQAVGVGTPVVGDWNGDDTGDVGKFLGADGSFLLDGNGSYTWDGVGGGDVNTKFVNTIAGGDPVIGTWGALTNDAIGRYVGDEFFLDWNGDNIWGGVATDKRYSLAVALGAGTPVVGDWNGDGVSDTGKFIGANAQFVLDANGNQTWDGVGGGDVNTIFAGAAAGSSGIPIVGDWDGSADADGDGLDDDEIGLWVPATGLVYVDYNGNNVWDGVGGGDKVFNLAQAIVGSGYLACDHNGDGKDSVVKHQATTSAFVSDLNENFVWDGIGGGDRSTIFVPAIAGTGATPLVRQLVLQP